MRYICELAKELPAISLPPQDEGIPLSAFPTAQQVNLPSCFLHCPFNAERQAGNTNFIVIGLTRLGIKPESTAQKTDALYHSAI